MVWCGHPVVLLPGPRFAYITLFDVLKNTNFEIYNEVRGILHNIRQAFASTCNSNLLTTFEGGSEMRVRQKTESANNANPQTSGKE